MLVTTRGDKGSTDPATDPDELAVRRRDETAAAAEALGLAGHLHLDYSDGELPDDHGPPRRDRAVRAGAATRSRALSRSHRGVLRRRLLQPPRPPRHRLGDPRRHRTGIGQPALLRRSARRRAGGARGPDRVPLGDARAELLDRHLRCARTQDRRVVVPREPARRDGPVVPARGSGSRPRRPGGPWASTSPNRSASSRSSSGAHRHERSSASCGDAPESWARSTRIATTAPPIGADERADDRGESPRSCRTHPGSRRRRCRTRRARRGARSATTPRNARTTTLPARDAGERVLVIRAGGRAGRGFEGCTGPIVRKGPAVSSRRSCGRSSCCRPTTSRRTSKTVLRRVRGGRPGRRHPRGRRQQPRRHRRARREGRRRARPDRGAAPRRRSRGSGSAYRAGFRLGLERGLRRVRRDGLRPLARPRRAARRCSRRRRRAPTS